MNAPMHAELGLVKRRSEATLKAIPKKINGNVIALGKRNVLQSI